MMNPDSPALKSHLLVACSHGTTAQQRSPCSSDVLCGALLQHQNPASATEKAESKKEGYSGVTCKAVMFGIRIQETGLTRSLSNGSKTISIPEQ